MDTRVFIISDLHLGGADRPMMSRPTLLQSFIEGLGAKKGATERLELVIAGDFIDFLAIPPQASWTPNPREAVEKLYSVTRPPEEKPDAAKWPFACVFDALQKFLQEGDDLTILLGNHDVELALPPVQEALAKRLGVLPRRLHWVDDGRAYRIGGALIEHGNRYDGANLNDWPRLRALSSLLSRGEPWENQAKALEVSAGSMLVEKVINPLKARYPFIDLLQPEGQMTALLLLAFEPGLLSQVKKFWRLLRAQERHLDNEKGDVPQAENNVASNDVVDLTMPNALRGAFGPAYDSLQSLDTEDVSASDWIGLILGGFLKESISTLLKEEQPIPTKRLRQIRTVISEILEQDTSSALGVQTTSCDHAASRLLKNEETKVVVMGHTHLPRFCQGGQGVYLNSGTWADRLLVPPAALEANEQGDQALTNFIADLYHNKRNPAPPNYVELVVRADGAVAAAKLGAFERRGPTTSSETACFPASKLLAS